MVTRIVLVDDHEIVRVGLTTLLQRDSRIDVVGTASTGEEGLEMVRRLEPDVAVVDYALPGMSGVEVCERIVARHPEIPVVILTTFLDDQVIRGALHAGAAAYVCKDVDGMELKKAIHAVARGESVLDPKVAGRVMRWSRAKQRLLEDGQVALSPRETDVLRLIARGVGTKDISSELGITENSVKTYVRRTMIKLGCNSRAQLAVLAARRGLA